MNYTILIYETPSDFADRSHPEATRREAYWSPWPAYSKAMKHAGIYVSGAGLEPLETGKSIRFDDDRPAEQDGSPTAAKEQIGGFFVLNVPDLKTALDWAARCSRSPERLVEVQPMG